jgi:cell shape-determining protein MreC
MSDLISRLRAMPSSLNDALRTMDEAADRIKALENENRRLRERLGDTEDVGK